MKEIIKSIFSAIIIILPLLLIMLFIFYINNYRFVVPITSNNIDIIQDYFDKSESNSKTSDIKEIALVHSSALAYTKYEIVYNNGEIKTFTIEIWEDGKGLKDYIYKNKINYDYTYLILILIFFSIIASVSEIHKMNKVEIIY